MLGHAVPWTPCFCWFIYQQSVRIQETALPHSESATYSTSAEERAMIVWCFVLQNTGVLFTVCDEYPTK